jgi:hypothetical protein
MIHREARWADGAVVPGGSFDGPQVSIAMVRPAAALGSTRYIPPARGPMNGVTGTVRQHEGP